MKERYDIKAEKGGFQPGDLVWLHNPRRRRGYSPKLQPSWEGPYVIESRINDVIYRIKKPPKGKPKIVHFNRLAPYKGDHGRSEEQRARKITVRPSVLEDYEPGCSKYGKHRRISMVYKDIFTMPSDYALAHCVAEDLRMSRGIATAFRKRFGRIEDLELQDPRVGKALHLKQYGRNVFYLVTKKSSCTKPTYLSLRKSLEDMRARLLQFGIKKLAIPKLGCGYDGLKWKVVEKMIEDLFLETGIRIIVCIFNPWGSADKANSGRTQPETVLGQNSLKEGAMLRSTGYGSEKQETTGLVWKPLASRTFESLRGGTDFLEGPFKRSTERPPLESSGRRPVPEPSLMNGINKGCPPRLESVSVRQCVSRCQCQCQSASECACQ